MKLNAYLFAVSAIITAAQSSVLNAQEPARPNILFIFCDDLTCQALSCYGDHRHLLDTPKDRKSVV